MAKTARLLARAHDGLHAGVGRLHRGHHVLAEAAARYRPPAGPKTPQPDKPSGSGGEPAPEATTSDADDTEATVPDAKVTKTGKKPRKKAPAKGKKGAPDDAKKKTKGKGDDDKEEEEEEPLRLGPRRTARAAARWVADGNSTGDTLLRLALLLLGFLVVAYFTAPLVEKLPTPVALLLPVAILLYDLSPRLSLLSGTIMLGFAADPAWALLGVLLLIGAAFAPLLAPLLALALTASAIYPALMWPVALLWGIAAWQAGAPAEEPAIKEADDGQEEEAEESAPVHPLLLLCATLTGTSNGVHLNAVVKALQEAGGTTVSKPAHLRAPLLALGVVVKDSVRAPKMAVPGGPESTASGVHREDLERVTGPLSGLLAQEAPESVATAVADALTCGVADSATAVAAS